MRSVNIVRQAIKKFLLIAIMCLLFLSNIHVGSEKVSAAAIIPEGTYNINFYYFEDGKDSVSMVQGYLKENAATRGKLVVEGEHATFQHEVTAGNASNFTYLGYKKPDSPKAVINKSGSEDTVSEEDLAGYVDLQISAVDPLTNNVTLTYELATTSLMEKQNILMHVYALNGGYVHWYHAELKLEVSELVVDEEEEQEENPSTLLKSKEEFDSLLNKAKGKLEAAVEGENYGQYKAGSIRVFELALQYVELAIPSDDNDQEAYGSLYTTLNKASSDFDKNLKLADRSEINQFVSTLNTFMAKVKRGGTSEGNPGADGVSAGTVAGEYYTSSVNFLAQAIERAQQVVDNPAATDEQIQMQINALNYNYNTLLETQYVKVEPIEFFVLDTRAYTTEQSKYANEIVPEADIIVQKKYESTYGGFFANLKFNVTDIENDLVTTSIGMAGSGDIYIMEPNPFVTIKAPLVSTLSTETQTVFQHLYAYYYEDISTSNWQGHTYISYTRESDGEQRKLYLSFNAAQLRQLQQSVSQAKALLEKSTSSNTAAVSAFEQEIQNIEPVSINLAATRPEIKAASDTLAAAVIEYKKHAEYNEYFTVINQDEDTVASIDSYLDKPAVITANGDEAVKVTLEVNNSSAVTAFQVKTDDVYENVEVIATNEAANKRTIAFSVAALDQPVEAQIRINNTVNALNEEQTYTVRVIFNGVNNVQLSAKIMEASLLYNEAVLGNQVGQYNQQVKNTFAASITAANQAVVSQQASQQQSDEQLESLLKAITLFKASANSNAGTPGSNDPVYPANGYYYVPFSIIKQGTDDISVANDYVVPTALVQVSGSSKTVAFTVLQSKEITGLKLNGSSGSILQTNSALNQRIVQFTIADLSKTLNGWVKVDWSAVNYHHEYDIQFKFDEAAAVYAGANPEVPGTTDQPGVPNLPNPNEELEEVEETDGTKEEEESNEIEEGTKPAEQVQFSDTASHWAKESIEKAVQLGIVNGYADGNFRPNATVSRGEFSVMLSRALTLNGTADTNSLTDYASIPSWAQEHVAKVVAAGIINGYADATFRASEQLTRAQLAVMITRAVQLEAEEATTLSFADAEQIPLWAQKEIAAAVKAGLIQGKANNHFDANGTATRAEALTLIIRLLELTSKEA